MSDQFSLPGFDAPAPPPRRLKAPQVARPRHSLFFAIVPAAADVLRIEPAAEALCQQHGMRRGRVAAERLHVTRCDLGSYDEEPPEALFEAARAVAARVASPAFEVAFDRVMRFKGSEALVLVAGEGSGPLKAFRDALGQALVDAGVPVDLGGTPHMTLAYGCDEVSELLAEPIGWWAQDFVLVHSLVRKGEHRIKGRWPLLARA